MPSSQLMGPQSQCVRICECMCMYMCVCMLSLLLRVYIDFHKHTIDTCRLQEWRLLHVKFHCLVIFYLTFDIIHWEILYQINQAILKLDSVYCFFKYLHQQPYFKLLNFSKLYFTVYSVCKRIVSHL